MAEKIRVLYVDDESIPLDPCNMYLERFGVIISDYLPVTGSKSSGK